MLNITPVNGIGELPIAELEVAVNRFMEPVLKRLPDKRLRVVGVLMILGILAGQSPLITEMARGVRDGSEYALGLLDSCILRKVRQ